MKNKRENIVDYIFCIICCIIMLGIGYTWGYSNAKNKYNHKVDIPTPVEKEVIDTLYMTRDSLIYRTQYLERIQHDTIEKIYTLDDSSTYKLFIELVSE